MVSEAISKPGKSVSSGIQTPWSRLKNSVAPHFFNPLLGVWIPNETVFLVFDILLQTLSSEVTKNLQCVQWPPSSNTIVCLDLWAPFKNSICCCCSIIFFFFRSFISSGNNLQEFSRSMDLSQPMKDFATSLVAKATTTSSPRSSLLRNYSDVSLDEMGDDKCFTLTKALGYHVVYGWFYIICLLLKWDDNESSLRGSFFTWFHLISFSKFTYVIYHILIVISFVHFTEYLNSLLTAPNIWGLGRSVG